MHSEQFPWVLSITNYLGVKNAMLYMQERKALENQVAYAVRGLPAGCRLHGSWARLDFHMDRSAMSLSDFDFTWPDSSEGERNSLTYDLARRLEVIDGLGAPRVSIHPSDSFANMPLAEQRIFNAAELAMGLLNADAISGSYVMSKGLLMLARNEPVESLWDVAIRRALPEVFLMRIGCIELMDLEQTRWRELLSTPVSEDLTAGEVTAHPRTAAEELERHFRQRFSDTNIWIYSRIQTKLERSLRARPERGIAELPFIETGNVSDQ